MNFKLIFDAGNAGDQMVDDAEIAAAWLKSQIFVPGQGSQLDDKISADVPNAAPAELYTNSTVALKAETGELVWYYQHLPGDDWGTDLSYGLARLSIYLDPT